MYRIVLGCAILLICNACKTNQNTTKDTSIISISNLDTYFSGLYSNQIQASSSSDILSLNLTIYPLSSWNDKNSHWYYIEEIPTDNHSGQINQKVYQFSKENSGLRCKSYAVIDPHKYVVADSGVQVLYKLTKQKLKENKGCDVLFTYSERGLIGNSEGKNCVSNINLADYSYIRFNIYKDKIEYWEQGITGDSIRVWGPAQPYIFNKIR